MIGVHEVVHQAVAIRIGAAGFDDVGHAVTVAVEICEVRQAVAIRIVRAVERIRNAVVVEVEIRRIGHAVAVAIGERAEHQRRGIHAVADTVFVAVDAGIDTAVVVGIERGAAGRDDVARAVVVGVEVAEVRRAVGIRIARIRGARLAGVHHRVAIRVDEARFDDVGQTVVVGVEIAHVGNAVAIGVGQQRRRALERIEDAVVVGIDVLLIGQAVAIGIARHRGIRHAVVVDVATAHLVDVEGIVDAVAVGVDAAGTALERVGQRVVVAVGSR